MSAAQFWSQAPAPRGTAGDWIMARKEPSAGVPWGPSSRGIAATPGSPALWVKEQEWRPILVTDLPCVVDWDGVGVAVIADGHLQFPEISRYLAGGGAKLFVVADERPRPDYRSGLWREVQQNQVLGLSWYPCPSLLVPCEMDPRGTGILPAAASAGPLRVGWTWQELADLRSRHPIWPRMRPDLYQRHWWGRT